MGYPRKEQRNRAIVLLRKCGMSFYAIAKVLGMKDKRNLIVVFKRDQNKYDLPSEQNQNQKSE